MSDLLPSKHKLCKHQTHEYCSLNSNNTMNTWLTNNVIHEYANRWHKLVINKFYYIHFTWISCHALGYCICSTRSQQWIIGVKISVLKLKQTESVDSIGIVIAWTLNNYIMIIQKKNLSKSYKPL